MFENKIKSREQLKTIIDALRKKHKKIVFTNGCFDILHVGHVRYLEKARMLGDVLIVALNSDSSVKKNKGPARPFVPENERVEIIAALESVSYCVLYPEKDAIALLDLLKPDVYCKGGDYSHTPEQATKDNPAMNQTEKRFVESYGGSTLVIPVNTERSSTELIEKISS